MPFAQLVDPVLIGIYMLCALLMVFLTLAVTLRRADEASGVDMKNAAFGALVAAFPNTGFMGVPLLVALFGDSAAGPVIGTVLVDLIVTSTLCIALAQSQRSDGVAGSSGVFGSVRRSLRSAATNPLPWAILLGALFAATGLRWPAPLAQVVKMLGESATPVAWFTIGAVLWRAGQHAHTRTPVRLFLPVALFKLLIHPLLVFGVGWLASAAGAPVPKFGLMVIFR